MITVSSVEDAKATGLTEAEARERLARLGPNEVAERRPHPVRRLLKRFWAPVPWMLEVSLALELVLGHRAQALIVFGLLAFNATLGLVEEGRAERAIELLRARLAVGARVRRDGVWRGVAARELVPGDRVHLRMGDVTPADCRVVGGYLLESRAALTGESLPVEVGAGGTLYAGSTLERGEADADVVRTGSATHYGRSAEFVGKAGAASHIEAAVLQIVRYLVGLDFLVTGILLVRAASTGAPLARVLPFLLMLLVASIPVALPATFTLATAIGSRELSSEGVLVAKLAALEEAAAMDVLCCDKTGTITRAQLAVTALRPFGAHSEGELLGFACQASDASTQDPIDLALIEEARRRGLAVPGERIDLVPFDPRIKRSAARVLLGGRLLHVLKGAPHALAELAAAVPTGLEAELERLAGRGDRVLAVASGEGERPEIVGLIGLSDPPRPDSGATLRRLGALGIRTILVTGDSASTARAIAAEIGIVGATRTAAALRAAEYDATGVGVVAEVFPEDKFRLVRGLQRHGHVVGMTGDGVNDAPALRQAEVGIAVSGATDVAKASAGIVLVSEGLSKAVDAVENGRRIYQRLLTYALNKIVKTSQAILFLGGWLLFADSVPMTPRLIVLLLFANDFVTMAIATDRVSFSPKPERWNVTALASIGLVLAGAWVGFGVAALLFARDRLAGLKEQQTFVFLMLVYTGQATVYLVRSRRRLWGARPSLALAASSAGGLLAASLLAWRGWLMAPLPGGAILGLAGAVALFAIGLDGLKVQIVELLQPHTSPPAVGVRQEQEGAPLSPSRARARP